LGATALFNEGNELFARHDDASAGVFAARFMRAMASRPAAKGMRRCPPGVRRIAGISPRSTARMIVRYEQPTIWASWVVVR
jgi:hypothetical protein